MEHILRIDGEYTAVDTAYDRLRQSEPTLTVDTESPLNIPLHPQSATAIDIVTQNSIAEIQARLQGLNVTVEEPADALVTESAML